MSEVKTYAALLAELADAEANAVPREPSTAMLDAGRATVTGYMSINTIAHIWRAMHEAARKEKQR